jgi:hypothetical protein
MAAFTGTSRQFNWPGHVSPYASPAYQGYQLLHFGFAVLPILAGLDKFFNLLVQWEKYLAPVVTQTTHIAPRLFMQGVGVVEIVAGLVVAFWPRVGGYIVAVWLWGIVINLLLAHGYYDVALRDFGLSIGALALARMSQSFARR